MPIFECHRALFCGSLVIIALAPACSQDPDEEVQSDTSELEAWARPDEYARIRAAARARGIPHNGYLLAAIAFAETGLRQCYSPAWYGCPGPASPDCNGGPILAGGGDGPCEWQQGGLGMFQFDAGTFHDTLNKYGSEILTMEGQLRSAVAYAVWMVKISAYTTDAETDEKALAWINRFDLANPTLRDQWVRTVVHYYNGCAPSYGCWSERYPRYNDAITTVLSETSGIDYWRAESTVTCPGGNVNVTGPIAEKYLALGGCRSQLGVPTSNESASEDGAGRTMRFENGSIYSHPTIGAYAVVGDIHRSWRALGGVTSFTGYPVTDESRTPDGVGRFNHFLNEASIYWTPRTGAHEVHGDIREKWKSLDWERGLAGYPTTHTIASADGRGVHNEFEKASIYATPETGAHEVHGAIRNKYEALGAEASALGYPKTDEYAVAGGRQSDFEGGSIRWRASDNVVTVTLAPAASTD